MLGGIGVQSIDRTFVSMIPGSTDIVIKVAPVKWACASKRPNRQFRTCLLAEGQGGAFVYESFEQRIDRNTASPCFSSETGFGFL